MRDWISLFRPSHWIKNGFVLTGYIFAKGWEQEGMTAKALLAFAAFCLVASAVYIGNDLFDRERDRHHPRKKNRPIARGSIAPGAAIGVCLALAAGALAIAWNLSQAAFAAISAYLLINGAYSWRLKSVVLLDVFAIAAGFFLRVVAGTEGIGIPPSNWILLCTFMLALFLGLSKRRAELAASDGGHLAAREVFATYDAKLLDTLLGIAASGVLLTYAMYTVDPGTVSRHHSSGLIYTIPVVTFGLFRYLFLLYKKNMGQELSREMFEDAALLATVAFWLVLVVLILR